MFIGAIFVDFHPQFNSQSRMLCFAKVSKFFMITEINISAIVTINNQIIECFGFNLCFAERVNLCICFLDSFFHHSFRQGNVSQRYLVDQVRQFLYGSIQYRFATFGISARLCTVS